MRGSDKTKASEGVPTMPQNASRLPGRHFLQIPGPTPMPDRIMRAMDMPLVDQRGPEFAKLGKRVLEGIKTIFKTAQPVIIYTATGTGAWEAALTNTLSKPASSPRCGRSWRSDWD
jgi:alanine-glyoxylate transaminase/serine-glyoxylate transaminase/serine-pyruvate transaminase